MDALVHLLTSVATHRYSRTAFFTLTQLKSHPLKLLVYVVEWKTFNVQL